MQLTSLFSALMLGTAALAIPLGLEKKQEGPSCTMNGLCESTDDCCEGYQCEELSEFGFSVCLPTEDPPFPSSSPSPSSSLPISHPTGVPASIPIGIPTSTPSGIPTSTPSGIPTSTPSGTPTSTPSGIPGLPTGFPFPG